MRNGIGRLGARLIVGAALLGALAVRDVEGAEFRAGQPVMGTVLQVTVVADEAGLARSLAENAVREARRWDDILTTWRIEGELARLNRAAGQGAQAISPDLERALTRMRRLSRATAGAFNPAVGPLVDRWRTPAAWIEATPHAAPRLRDVLTLRRGTAALAPGSALDAGGVGKGMALDAMADQLRHGGARAAFIDFGGSSQVAVGAPPDDQSGWHVVVAGLSDLEAHGTLTLRDGALSTSRATGAGEPAGPIIDPVHGTPVAAPIVAVVLAPDATAADAWSTALVVLGRKGLAAVRAAGLDALVQDAAGTDMTPGMRTLLKAHSPS